MSNDIEHARDIYDDASEWLCRIEEGHPQVGEELSEWLRGHPERLSLLCNMANLSRLIREISPAQWSALAAISLDMRLPTSRHRRH